jgi:hypothetical protein
MKRIALLIAVSLIVGPFVGVAGADTNRPGGNTGNVDVSHNAGSGGDNFETTTQTVTVGDYAASGIGLRNLGSGTIAMDDIPEQAIVTQAFLYWQIQANAEQESFTEVTLDGQDITGEKIGEDGGLCWASSDTYAYRADVTNVVTGSGDYKLEDVDTGQSNGEEPGFGPTPEANGASIVAVYADPTATPRQVTIVDGYQSLYGDSVTVEIPTFTDGLDAPVDNPVDVPTLPTPGGVGEHRLTGIAGDGQSIFPDRTLVNGEQIAYNNWDGSDPQRVPDYNYGNLWDTDTFDVTEQVSATGGPLTTTVGFGYDCIGPQAFVYSAPLP